MKYTPDEDSQEYFDFWRNEREKCKHGIFIDNIFLSGFLYYHLNFFKCQLDIQEDGRIVRKLLNPYLRDNEWIIDGHIRNAEEQKKGLCILGSRRLAKSVYEASYITHRATFFKGTQNVIAGLNDPDIGIITGLCEEALTNLPKPFKKGRVEDNWKKQVSLGSKTDTGERKLWSSIPIRNLDGGQNTEALAGLSPFSMVIDEIGKGDWLKCFSAAIPGFATPYGWRCSPLCFGTSGDMDKAQDAVKVFDSPEAYNFIAVEMKDEPDVKKSVFMSGHYAHDFPKDNKPLNEFLNITKERAPNLNKIIIQVTNYERAEVMIDEERAQAKKSNDIAALLKLTMYHPKNRHELFLTNSNNNFPKEEIEQWQTWLKDNYDPQIVDFYTDIDGKIKHRGSNKGIITEFPCKPDSNKEAGIVIYEDFIEGLPFGTYVGGLDLYNQNESSDRVNSLGSYYILKRMYDPLGDFQYCIVASYSARPSLKEFKDNVVLMMKYYNAYTLVEHTNTEAIDWFIERGLGAFFAEGLGIAKEVNPFATSGHNIKGTKPTPGIQKHYMNIMVGYTKEVISNKILETGINKEQLGLTRILDIMLLEEMKNYRSKESTSKGVHDGNFDRCFPKGHKVNTINGYKDISEIVIGDEVLTHTGNYEKVYEIFKNNYNDKLYRIKPVGNDKFIESTENHPFLIGRYSKKPHGRAWYKRKQNLDIIDWVKAKDIKKGDFMFIPFKKERIERTLSDEALYLLGWYLSDGNISKKGQLRICFQGDQIEMALRCKEILEKYDEFLPTYFESTHRLTGKKFQSHTKKKKPSIKKIKDKYAYALDCTSIWFNNIVKKYITVLEGGEKILNQNLINQKDLIPLILGFFEGDGNQAISNYDGSDRNSLTLAGTYLTMIYQFREAILNEGIWCTISPTEAKDENHNNQLRLDIQDWNGINKIVENSLKFKKVSLTRKQKENFLKKEDGFWIPIRSVEVIDFQGIVYNCEVENDHSYTVDFMATHNCVSFGHALMLARHLDKVQPLGDFKFEKEDKERQGNVILKGIFQMQGKKQTPTRKFLNNPFLLR